METNTSITTESGFEFNEEQNTTIKSLSTSMRWVGAVLLVIGVLQCLAGVLTIAKAGLANLGQGLIMIVFAVYTYKAAYAFRRIVDSAGQDINHLMAALCSLRSLYRLQIILLLLAVILIGLGFALLGISSMVR